MGDRKEIRKYCFTVEGETEKWYLDWLEEKINAHAESIYCVSINGFVQKSPIKFSKMVNAKATPKATHWCDYESNNEGHIREFKSIIEQLKKSSGIGGKNFKYNLGYCNFAFELWIVLHKYSCNGSLSHRAQYLELINRAFNEHFEDLHQHKHEDHFKRILRGLTLKNVIEAIERSKIIMLNNERNCCALLQYKGYKYYTDNPALTIWESVECVLKECKIIQ